jgi:hypothetical protein
MTQIYQDRNAQINEGNFSKMEHPGLQVDPCTTLTIRSTAIRKYGVKENESGSAADP